MNYFSLLGTGKSKNLIVFYYYSCIHVVTDLHIYLKVAHILMFYGSVNKIKEYNNK